jgi:hypothetical protein
MGEVIFRRPDPSGKGKRVGKHKWCFSFSKVAEKIFSANFLPESLCGAEWILFTAEKYHNQYADAYKQYRQEGI